MIISARTRLHSCTQPTERYCIHNTAPPRPATCRSYLFLHTVPCLPSASSTVVLPRPQHLAYSTPPQHLIRASSLACAAPHRATPPPAKIQVQPQPSVVFLLSLTGPRFSPLHYIALHCNLPAARMCSPHCHHPTQPRYRTVLYRICSLARALRCFFCMRWRSRRYRVCTDVVSCRIVRPVPSELRYSNLMKIRLIACFIGLLVSRLASLLENLCGWGLWGRGYVSMSSRRKRSGFVADL